METDYTHIYVSQVYAKRLIHQSYSRWIKRCCDVVFSVCVLILLCSWLFPLIALLIKMDSPGPVFYRQMRWGRNNRPFYCLKFRSMFFQALVVCSKGKFRPTSRSDVRTTRVGAFLRRTSLDELPQFINVLMGDMSIVGPRPHAHQMNLEAQLLIPSYCRRHEVKPGITGWAQIRGYRGDASELNKLEARVAHDLWYIRNWHLILDIKIIALTIRQVLFGDEGAY